MNANGNYRKTFLEEKRKKISDYISLKHPEKLPIIVEYEENFPNEFRIEECKYLVNNSFRVFEFTKFLREKIKLSSVKGLLVYINFQSNKKQKKILINQSDLLGTVHNNYSHTDGFLYLSLGIESVFG